MGFKTTVNNKAGGEDYELVPQGQWPAVLVGLFDIGTHDETFNGDTKTARKIVMAWQVFPDDHEPMTIVRDYTLSLAKKANLRGLVEGWKGTGLKEDEEFDLSVLLGKPCNLTVIHEQSKSNPERSFSRVKSATKPVRGQQMPEPTIKPLAWSVDDGQPFPKLPYDVYVYGEQVQDKLKRAHELRGGNGRAPAGGNSTQEEAEVVF